MGSRSGPREYIESSGNNCDYLQMGYLALPKYRENFMVGFSKIDGLWPIYFRYIKFPRFDPWVGKIP